MGQLKPSDLHNLGRFERTCVRLVQSFSPRLKKLMRLVSLLRRNRGETKYATQPRCSSNPNYDFRDDITIALAVRST